MSPVRPAAAGAVGVLCRMVGRRPVVRAARFVLRRARLDLPNDPATNGERQLQRWLLATAPPARPVTVLDVGANVGRWSRSLLDQGRELAPASPVRLHAFEPAPEAYRLLERALPEAVRVNQLAVSDTPGAVTLHVAGPTAGTSSLCGGAGADGRTQPVPVQATTVDDYLRAHDIDRVSLLKVDAEGHDFAVLCGARDSLAAHAIDAVQFEYNHRWVYARHFLKDVFDLLAGSGYRIGKVTPYGIEFYPGWHPELEMFIEGNYLACTGDLAARLPRVSWWHAVER